MEVRIEVKVDRATALIHEFQLEGADRFHTMLVEALIKLRVGKLIKEIRRDAKALREAS